MADEEKGKTGGHSLADHLYGRDVVHAHADDTDHDHDFEPTTGRWRKIRSGGRTT